MTLRKKPFPSRPPERMEKRPNTIRRISLAATGLLLFFPAIAGATQMHSCSEGIIVHQLGHLFFLLSMIILIFTINGKGLRKQCGWRLIQYAAFMFILWNLDTITAHFLDNQIDAVQVALLPESWEMAVTVDNGGSPSLPLIYYVLKMDHLLCVPAIFLFYRGLRSLLKSKTDPGTGGA